MNQEHLEQMKHMDERIDDVDNRLDRHLEIYANNGKEMARLAQAIEAHIKSQDNVEIKVNEMYKIFNDGKIGTKIVKWVFRVLIAIGSAVIIYKGIFAGK